MGGHGKQQRWWFSFHRSPSSKLDQKDPPTEYLCPISGGLMFDPVVVSSGQTFERTSVQVCKDLAFQPQLSDGGTPDFTAVINLALKTAILSCQEDSRFRVSEKELLRQVADHPPVLHSHAATELNPRNNHQFYSSSSSEESVIASGSPLLPFTTRPVCFSTPSSQSNSSEIEAPSSASTSSSEDGYYVVQFNKLDAFD
nr:U-box domain-containing protein 38-like [Ipomoea batatas]